MKSFQQENNELLKFILNERFFKNWKKDIIDQKDLHTVSELEFFITNQCNQHCEYCYLYDNYQLYPKEAISSKTILNNLEIVFNWLIEQQFYINKIDFFSGEIWHTQFGLDILEATYQAIQRGLKIKNIMIPTNGCFVLDENKKQKIQNYITAYQAYGVALLFSFSIDGKIIDNLNRPRNNNQLYDDIFYQKLFDFAYHNNFYFHPMVAAYSIELWQENFLWWKNMCDKYNFKVHERVMMLEVRNDDWTTEKIAHYCQFVRFLLDDFRETYPNHRSVEDFSYFLFGNFSTEESYSYLPWNLALVPDIFSCTVATQLCIRLGDLTIAPCHRTSYDKFLYGKFIIKGNKIVDIEENNLYLAERILYFNNIFSSPKCDTCEYNSFCLKGCAGSQYENTNDLFFPINSVCNLEKAKIDTLIEYYQNFGIFDYLKNFSVDNLLYTSAKNFLEAIDVIQEKKKP